MCKLLESVLSIITALFAIILCCSLVCCSFCWTGCLRSSSLRILTSACFYGLFIWMLGLLHSQTSLLRLQMPLELNVPTPCLCITRQSTTKILRMSYCFIDRTKWSSLLFWCCFISRWWPCTAPIKFCRTLPFVPARLTTSLTFCSILQTRKSPQWPLQLLICKASKLQAKV